MRHIIGIAGPSCSGKTVVAKRLAEILRCDAVSIDNQYIRGHQKVYVDSVRTLERPEMYDGQKVAEVASEWKSTGKSQFKEFNFQTKDYQERALNDSSYLILEGFILLTYPQIRSICTKMFYIDLSWNEIVHRRIGRGRETTEKIDAFLRIGRKEMDKYVLPQKTLPGVVVLSGHASIEDTVKEIRRLSQL